MKSPETTTYIGNELEIFKEAKNWKRYWGRKIRPYLGSSVLEVGVGIGGTTRVLCENTSFDYWLGIDPDAQMIADLEQQKQAGEFPGYCHFRAGQIQSLAPDEIFDSVIYIDVLEHIEHDAQEILDAGQHLKNGGHLVVLSPAYHRLYTEFDESIGHYRRYNADRMKEITPKGLTSVASFYLDSVGLLASLGNLLFLHSPMPSLEQILFWDRWMVPVSQLTDRLTLYKMGRSIIHVWQRTDG